MKKISEKGRKIIRKICMLLGASAISMLFAACYGMPMDDYDHLEDCTYPCCQEDPSPEQDDE